MNGILSKASKHKVIEELKAFWTTRPKYRDMAIQGSYSFEGRPQNAIVVRASGGSDVPQSADNFRAVVHSYVYHTKFQNHPGAFIEWVREDGRAIQANGGYFPSPPGLYFLQVVGENQLTLDALLEHTEPRCQVAGVQVVLPHVPVPGSIRLYEQPNNYRLVEGLDFVQALDSQNQPTNVLTLSQALPKGRTLSAFFRYAGPLIEGHPIAPELSDNQLIPGVVLAFTPEIEIGDYAVVVVQSSRVPAYLEFGGRWQTNVELEIICRDSDDRDYVTDKTLLYMKGVVRSRFADEGIQLEVSPGGEAEEPSDEVGDDYFYLNNITLTLESDWQHLVPLDVILRSVDTYTQAQLKILAGYTEVQWFEHVNNTLSLGQLGVFGTLNPEQVQLVSESLTGASRRRGTP